MYRRKNVLVTGTAGFIGFHLIKYFANNPNYFVVAIDDFSRGKCDDEFKNLRTKSNNILCDEMDMTRDDFDETLDFIMKDLNIDYFDNIYHLAAVNGTKNFYKCPDRVIDVNINSTLNLLK